MKRIFYTFLKAVSGLALTSLIPVAHAQSANYKVEPTHTFVTWEATHFSTSTSRGRFDKKDGDITFDKTTGAGKAEFTIELTSVSTGVAPFDKHMKESDFFDVEKFPTAKFTVPSFKIEKNKPSEFSGNLTLRGITKPVKIKMAKGFNCYQNPFVKREVCGGDFEATIKRSEFGITYGLADKVVSEDVRVVIQVEAILQ